MSRIKSYILELYESFPVSSARIKIVELKVEVISHDGSLPSHGADLRSDLNPPSKHLNTARAQLE